MGAGSVFLFLDFDGTLAPLARTPREAVLPAGAFDILTRLSALSAMKLAVVSGRRMADLKQ
ncbi:MAG TPA: trehalose-phosphatase, partial [Candidatus Bathyarchaeia archaeon]|nr:trehalose-phosphatase [Candidatus Bathyarchaeia archaeon]